METTDYRDLLRRSAIALALCTVAVVICYVWVDRPVAFYVHDRGIEKIEFSDGVSAFKWLTLPPPEVQNWSPFVLVLLMIRRAFGPLTSCEWTLFVACVSLIVADEFRQNIGEVAGRYWPETWHDNNPSLIGTGTYGFHPFERGDDTGSFPSGHSARVLGFATVWWLTCPRIRPLLVIVCLPMLLALIALNYHFVSDVIAGSTVGAIVATYAVHLGGLASSAAKIPMAPTAGT